MKTILTTSDILDMINEMFKENDEQIILTDIDDGSQTTTSLLDYLNVELYAWQDKQDSSDANSGEYLIDKLYSLQRAFGLVEIISEEASESADLDSVEKTGRIAFHIQADKAHNLDYFINKVRNAYLGKPFVFKNAFGDELKAYFALSILSYEEEPTDTQLGYTLVATTTFRLAYMTNASTYNDISVEMSLDGGITFYEMPILKETYQVITTSQPVPKSNRPDLVGQLVGAISSMKTFSFYDYNMALTQELNRLFWSLPAVRVNNIPMRSKESLNIPVKLRVTSNGNVYIYDDVIDNMQLSVENNTYNIMSIALKTDALAKESSRIMYYGTNNITDNIEYWNATKDITASAETSVFTKQLSVPNGVQKDTKLVSNFIIFSTESANATAYVRITDADTNNIVDIAGTNIVIKNGQFTSISITNGVYDTYSGTKLNFEFTILADNDCKIVMNNSRMRANTLDIFYPKE